jgi:hypothetical protein
LASSSQHIAAAVADNFDAPRAWVIEFWAMLGIIVATLIAAAVADNFDAPRAWVIVGFVAAAYIVSRGLAKVGTAHRDPDESTRRY